MVNDSSWLFTKVIGPLLQVVWPIGLFPILTARIEFEYVRVAFSRLTHCFCYKCIARKSFWVYIIKKSKVVVDWSACATVGRTMALAVVRYTTCTISHCLKAMLLIVGDCRSYYWDYHHGCNYRQCEMQDYQHSVFQLKTHRHLETRDAIFWCISHCCFVVVSIESVSYYLYPLLWSRFLNHQHAFANLSSHQAATSIIESWWHQQQASFEHQSFMTIINDFSAPALHEGPHGATHHGLARCRGPRPDRWWSGVLSDSSQRRVQWLRSRKSG